MAIEEGHIITFGAANHATSDTGTQGGAESASTKLCSWFDLSAATEVNIVAQAANTNTITITGRNAAGEIVTDVMALTGTTAVKDSSSPNTFERLVSAEVTTGATTTTWAVINDTATITGTAQSAAANYLQLASSAISTDNDYQFYVIRIDSATGGASQLREIVKTTATGDYAYVRNWDTTPTGTITYSVYEGMCAEHFSSVSTYEDFTITKVLRPFYNVAAPASGGDYVAYEKGFVHNLHSSLALTNGTITEVNSGVASNVAFALETSLDGTVSATDRTTLPGSIGSWITDQTAENIVNSQSLSSTAGQGIWMRLTLTTSDTATNSFWKFQTAGQST